MSEEIKMETDTVLQWMDYNQKRYVSLCSLMTILAEVYQKAAEIGWETKVLDELNERLRDIHNL